jgi:hypothetical protein
MIIPSKTVKMYPNNKPWVTSAVKGGLVKKRLAFQQGSLADQHAASRELKTEISKAKNAYKSKMEDNMASNNLGSVWSSMRTIVGHQNPKSSSRISLNGFNSDIELSNAFNVFYNRFDTVDFSNTTQEPEDMLVDTQHFKIEQKEVEKALLKIKVNKSHGPDKICGRLLKSCAVQLSHVFNYIFNMSLKAQHVPEIWKDARCVTYRTQRVRINGALSDPVCSSTGSPQGCVLSPLLFILYTNMCRSQYENRLILKYADDSVVVSLLRGGESSHGPVIVTFLDGVMTLIFR